MMGCPTCRCSGPGFGRPLIGNALGMHNPPTSPGLLDTPDLAVGARMSTMPRRKRRNFTPEQKWDAVRLVRKVGNLAKVARDFDLTETALPAWVKQAEIDGGRGSDGALTTEEREELHRLRRRVRTLKLERDFANKPWPSSPGPGSAFCSANTPNAASWGLIKNGRSVGISPRPV